MKRQEKVNRGRRSRPAGRTGARPQSRTARGDGGQNAARFSNSGTATDARTQRAPRRRVARSHARPPRRPRRGRGRARGGAARGKRRRCESPRTRREAAHPRNSASSETSPTTEGGTSLSEPEPSGRDAKMPALRGMVQKPSRRRGEPRGKCTPPPPAPVRVGADEDALHPGLSALRGDRLT